MNFMFDVYVGNTNRPLSEAHANITLPATPYQLLDAMGRLQIKNPEDEYYQIEDYYDCKFLSSYLHGKASLTQLNTLAQKLSEMEEWRKDALEGLLKMDALKENRLPSIERVIDLAHSTDSCQVLYEARNDKQLGRFYAENGFIPEVEDISDEVFEMPTGFFCAASRREQRVISYGLLETFDTFCVMIKSTFPSMQSRRRRLQAGALSILGAVEPSST